MLNINLTCFLMLLLLYGNERTLYLQYLKKSPFFHIIETHNSYDMFVSIKSQQHSSLKLNGFSRSCSNSFICIFTRSAISLHTKVKKMPLLKTDFEISPSITQRKIHNLSSRTRGSFCVNCGRIRKELLTQIFFDIVFTHSISLKLRTQPHSLVSFF